MYIPGVYFTDIHEISYLITEVVPEWLRDHQELRIDNIQYGILTNLFKGFSAEPCDIDYFRSFAPEFTWIKIENDKGQGYAMGLIYKQDNIQ